MDQIAVLVDDTHGKMVRSRFGDHRGSGELGMLAAPSGEELEQLRRAVAIMTPSEKERADKLSDEQVQRIASDARVDPADLAIFINGYAINCKRVL